VHKIIFIVLLFLSSNSFAFETRARPTVWATPIISEYLQNWYQIDSELYRSEQPDEQAMEEIETFGIKSILNLREFHDDNDEIKGTHLIPLHVPIRTQTINDAHIVKALQLIQKSDKPVLVHCWHGADRTGTVIAMYRMTEQGWSREAAIDELIHGGYNYHSMFGNIITYLENVDIEVIKQQMNKASK